MKKIDVKEVLPGDIIINSAETHLYRIGLCLTPINLAKRNHFHYPPLIFIVNLIALIKAIISLLLTQQNEYLFIIIGDFSYLVRVKTHFNIACGLYTILALISQLIYYYNYKNGKNATYLEVFEMMSGLVSPKSIGLTNQ